MQRLRNNQIIYGRHGREYRLRLVAEIKGNKGETVYGRIDRTRKIIWIRKGLALADQYMILLHELIHDLAEDYEECNLKLEVIVGLFTGDLFDVLRRNGFGFTD